MTYRVVGVFCSLDKTYREENMAETDVLYEKADAIATITFNRPDKFNALRASVIRGFDEALGDANRDHGIKVIILQGAGDSFCAGFDFSGNLDHQSVYREDGYDPGLDLYYTANGFT